MSQVVIGQLKDQYTVATSEGTVELTDWNQRAMWSYLRLRHGRKIDQEIKDTIEQKFGSNDLILKRGRMALVFPDFLKRPAAQREIQFILNGENHVMAVASLQHLLISPKQIYEVTDRLMAAKGMNHLEVVQLKGHCYQINDFKDKGITLGLQVHGGVITTRQAITVASMFRVNDCLNPLSWLGASSFKSFNSHKYSHLERILRIKRVSELEPRLQRAIEEGLKGQKKLEFQIAKAQDTPLGFKSAQIIAAALGLSYHLGAKTIKQLLDVYASEEKRTQYGLSMAGSWMAAHGDFKKTPKTMGRSVEQKLATISGVTLLFTDLKGVEKRCLEWLQTKVEKGKVKKVDELLEEIGL